MVIAQTNPPNLASDATKTSFTPDEYRAMEETAEERHEYCNGEIIAMPGGSEVHSAIACNLLIHLGFLLRDTDFRLYNSDLRVWIPEYNCGTYTDLMVVNGEPEFHGSRTDEILNPLLIVVNICWSVKLNHILNNITISIARRAIAGNGKCTIGLKGRSSCTA
ncbi:MULTISPECIES: Uma2 family endonuclease [unclassified Microcoleus]|uniref:Uma2 family endonuclease n=1 Tax=unclassified Microcoleus TaxID=2642155 RepID=UPI0025E151AD|nr:MULTISPECIES: Uma2 family endonuclease [unclassified Microcoleus]